MKTFLQMSQEKKNPDSVHFSQLQKAEAGCRVITLSTPADGEEDSS